MLVVSVVAGCGGSGDDGDTVTNPEPTTESEQPDEPEANPDASMTGEELLAVFGSQGRSGVTEDTLEGYRVVFDRIDSDGSGEVSADEYAAAGYFPEETARAINRGQDFDESGGVSVDEYVEHRIHTDEGKEIHAGMDADGDGSLPLEELLGAEVLPGDAARNLYEEVLDIDGSGAVNVPEWLGAWGTWVWGEWIAP